MKRNIYEETQYEDLHYEGETEIYEAPVTVCRNCGEDKVHWVFTRIGWVLFSEDNKTHDCKRKIR